MKDSRTVDCNNRPFSMQIIKDYIDKKRCNGLNILILIMFYSLMWFMLASALYLIFRLNHRSFLWLADGKFEHYVAYDYLCDYLKRMLHGEGLGPFFNFTIAQGQDILSALVGYDFTDPICWITAFIFPLSKFRRYTLMIFLKLFITGISFIIYCITMEKDNEIAILSGAIAYTFSGVVLFSIIRHPNFSCWYYFFPFMLAAIESFYRKEKKLPLILVVFFNAIVNYYVFYINVILTIIYVIIKTIFEKDYPKMMKKIVVIVILGVIGVGLSAFCILPVAYGYTQQVRVGQATGYTNSLLFYPISYYLKLIPSFFSPFSGCGYYTHLGFNAVIIIPLFFLFTRKKYTKWKVLIVIFFIMLCVPLIGKIMNGFSYPINRWSYAFAFVASYLLVETFPDIMTASEKDRIMLLLSVIMYSIICILFFIDYKNAISFLPLYILLWVAIVFLIIGHTYPQYLPIIILLSCFFSAFFAIHSTFAKSKSDYVSEHEIRDAISYETSAVATPKDEGFFRVETKEDRYNVSKINGINGMTSFWAIMPQTNLYYYSGLNLRTNMGNCLIKGLDGRTGLLALSSTKYYTCPIKEKTSRPYGYVETSSAYEKYSVFENLYALPIGYTYSSYISEKNYNALNGLEKEQALMQGAVLGDSLSGFNQVHPNSEYDSIKYNVEGMKDVQWKKNQIDCRKENGSVYLTADIPVNCEIYVYFHNTEPVNKEKAELTIKRTFDGGEINKNIQILGLSNNWYFGMRDLTVNLGSEGAGFNTITINFLDKVKLNCDSIEIIAVPMEPLQEKIKELREYVLEDVEVKDDYVSGNIDLPEKRILQFSIPYSKGWRAIVDGEEQELLLSDVMYMALPLSAGKHSIQLYYQTPYLKEGIIVSLCTLCLCIIYGLIEIFIKKKRKIENG